MAQKPQTRANAAPQIAGANQAAGGIFVDQQDATALAPREFAEGDETGFLENFSATFDATMRSGLTVSKYRSRSIAYDPIVAEINKGREGSDHLTNPWTGASRSGVEGRIRPRAGVLGIDFSGGWAGVTPQEQEQAIWAEIGRRRQKEPGFLPGIPRSREELTAKVDDDDRAALEADDEVGRRASLWGSAGGFVGGVGASFRDPINLLSLPLGAGAAKTILGAALREGAINAGLTAVTQPAIAQRNNELGREYGLDEAVTATLYGGIGGVVLGGGAKGAQLGAQKLGRRIARRQAVQITRIAESGDRDFHPDGRVVTSPAGARYAMQVMPATAADPGFGVKPARSDTPAEWNRVGEQVLEAMLKKYKNDPRKAWAAYNWGTGNIDKVIAKHGAGWFDHVPAETSKYVNKNTKALGRQFGYGTNWMGPAEGEAAFPPATADQVSAAITLEGLDELGRSSPLPATAEGQARHLETLQTHVDAIEADQPRPAAAVEPIVLKRPDEVRLDRYDPRELVVDPTRFQFKGGGDADGVLDTLRGVKEWNPILSGKAVVWLDESGKPHVADGHQRVGLARRLLGETPGADIKIDAVTLRAEDGVTAEMARTWAALKNVAEGSGSPIDAAKVLRATGDSTPIPLPPRSALVRDARSLAALSDDAFGMVVNEVVPPSYAALVGRLAPAAPELHAAYLQLLHRLEPASLTQADSIVRQAIAAGATRETQLGLFGEEIVSRSLYLERARVLDNSLRRLKNDKRIFRTLIDARDNIEGAGNVLDPNANAAKVENNAQALEILTRLAHRTGPVSDALGRAASELAAGRSAKSAVDRFIAELDELDISELARGVERSPGDGNALGGYGREASAGEPASAVPGEPGGDVPAGDAGGADAGLGEPIGTDLFGNPVYAERADVDELDGTATLEAAVDEAQEGFQLEAFADPHGAGAQRQAELVEHDMRLEAEQARQIAQDARTAPIAGPGTQLTRDAVLDAQRGRTLEEMLSNAGTNQRELAAVAEPIAAELGVEFKNPGPKGAERAREKVEHELAGDPSEMLDLSRGAFIVDTAEHGQAIADRLLAKYAVFDKGWKRTGAGYYDRKLIVQFPNGGTAEVQIVPRAIWDYRKAAGHKLYVEARAPGIPEARAAELHAEMAAGYDGALAASSFDQSAGRGTLGNAAENAGTSSGSPSSGALATNPGDGAQAPALRDQENASRLAPEPTTATGRSSTSNNLTTDIDILPTKDTPDMGAPGENVNGALSWEEPATVAAIDAHNQAIDARRPSSQDSAAGDRNGSGPRSESGSGARDSAEGGTSTGAQRSPEQRNPRTPAGEETTSAGAPPIRTNEAIMTSPDGQAGAPAGELGLALDRAGVNPQIGARRAEMTQLRVNSPLRSIEDQAPVDGLSLFDQARSPELFALGERLDDGAAVPELRTADDLLAELDAEDAAIAAIEGCLV